MLVKVSKVTKCDKGLVKGRMKVTDVAEWFQQECNEDFRMGEEEVGRRN